METKKYAAFWKYFRRVNKLKKNMKNSFSKIVVLLGVVILQACTSLGEKNIGVNTSQPEAPIEQAGISYEVGQLEVGDSLLSDATNEIEAREYTVVEIYTAASGRTCREVDIRKLDGSEEVETSVLCQKKTGSWYWPRDVIFK